ncbi:MAG: tetratricopeptide repeat protein [Litorimonas sp.]
MKRRLITLTFAAVIALSCQSVDNAYAAPETQNLSELYGDYLAGSYAQKIQDRASQQKYFTNAFLSQPDDVRIGRRAIVSALETGDMAAAVKLAERVLKSDKTEPMGRAVLGVDAFRRGRESRALKYFSGRTNDVTMTILMQLVRGWTEIEKKDYEAARQTFASLEAGSYFEAYAELQLAKIDGLQGETEAALERLDAVDEAAVSGVETLLTRVRILSAADRSDEAIAALEEILVDNEGLSIGPVGAYLKRLKAGKSLPAIDAKGEAARALTEPALGFFARNRSLDGAEIFLRFARWIEPEHTKSALWLGSILEDRDDAGQQEAFEFYKAVREDDPYYISSQLNIANIHFNREDDDKAIETLEALNEREQSVLTRESLGRARFFRENYEEALPFYKELVDSMTDEEITANVEPLRFRAIIYERLNRWPEAEADFKHVLKLVPDDVDTLNYLGYTWVDRGENLTEAFDMIREAVKQQPQSGAIVDSLGWAHYKLGEYDKARENLEDAVALSPSSATIIDHLGDVYWKLGRKREAGFQWKRALEFDPTDEERATIELKLDKGLEAVPAKSNALP